MTSNKTLILFICLISSILLLSKCKVASRIFFYNVPSISDHHIFPKKIITGNSQNCQEKLPIKTSVKFPAPHLWAMGKSVEKEESIHDFLNKSNTNAFVVIRNDTILYERYANNFTD